MTAPGAVLAYVPFLHPIHTFHQCSYLLLVPLAFGIALIYKAMRSARLEGFWREVTVMTVQIIVAMIALAIGLAVLVQVIVPLLPVE